MSFAFADSPQGGGEASASDASEARAFLLHTAKPKRAPRPVAGAPASDGLLEEAASPANLARALLNVVRNKGAPGVDGQTVEAAEKNAPALIGSLREALLRESYRPGAVRRVSIPKPGGGRRDLGIPNVVDRVAQQAVLQVLEPIFEPTFHPSSHGFRRDRGAPTAIAEAKTHLETGRQTVVDIDLAKFFDRVDHQRLMDRLARKVSDPRVLALVQRWLKAGVVMPDGVRIETHEGTPQGGPLSPLLSNIVLDELDWELARRGHRFVRYADDCNVFVRSERAGRRVMASICDFLERRMRLKVNAEKSAVRKPWAVHFLGFRFSYRSTRDGRRIIVMPSAKADKRLKATLRAMTPPNWGRPLNACMKDLSRYLSGWMAHFRLCTEEAVKGFGTVDAHIRRRLRAIIIHHKKRRRFLLRHLWAKGVTPRAAAGAAYNPKGRWFRSNHPGMTQAYPPSWFQARMTSLKARWIELNRAKASEQLAFAF
ncbi:MAG TPA: group II intron reverse transcriptase/maturase [Roseiarcus sp.]|nr:group II intron reverse transcriptase/maturase [Roseiarcus sp.]